MCWPAQTSCIKRDTDAARAKIARLEESSEAQASSQPLPPLCTVREFSAAIGKSQLCALHRGTPAM